MKENVLAIMSKYPSSGNVKTRLGASIGMPRAADLSRALLLDLIENHKDGSYDLIVEAPSSDARYLAEFERLVAPIPVRIGTGDWLRGKTSQMWGMFTYHLKDYRKVVAVYADAPKVGKALVKEAFLSLELYDVVVGPDLGVGYYLIGMGEAYDLFTSLRRDRGPYFESTLDIVHRLGLSYKLLNARADIDTVDDLKLVQWAELEDDWSRTARLLRELGLLTSTNDQVQ